MTEKEKSVPGVALRRKGDPPVTEPEIVDAEVVETDNVEKEERQGSRRPVAWKTEILQGFGIPPFPLTDEKLAGLVQRIDAWGPMQLGAFYPAILQQECGLLLPQPVYGVDDWRFFALLSTWNRNFTFFKCRAIGDVLAYLEMARQNYETMRQNDADNKE